MKAITADWLDEKLHQEEIEHQAEKKQVESSIDWLKVFPEAESIVRSLLAEKTAKRSKLAKSYIDHFQAVQSNPIDEITQFFRLELAKHFYIPKIIALKKHIERLQKDLGQPTQNPKSKKGHFQKYDLEQAKSVSLVDIAGRFTDYMKVGAKQATIRCPFHQPDRHPSCVIYLATNTFYCFACGEKGDVISFVQKTLHCSFLEALRWLTGRMA